MNIQSMTGYGKGTSGNFKVEVRSSNQRNLEIRTSIPQYLYLYEPEIRKIVKEKFYRGRIEIYIPKPDEENIKLKLNKSLAKEYYKALLSLKNELSISGDVGINILALQRDIFSIEESAVDISTFRESLENALEELKKMRLEEGKNLANDIIKRITILNNYMADTEDRRNKFITNINTALTEKLKNLINNVNVTIDESRLVQEIVLIIEKSDFTEEVVRINSHLKHMRDIMLGKDEVIGKKLEFFAQELHRELNTIGSKATDAEISRLVVEMKHELEKIREQAQNLQ